MSLRSVSLLSYKVQFVAKVQKNSSIALYRSHIIFVPALNTMIAMSRCCSKSTIFDFHKN